ncbi:hypothetical protein EVAR_94699_1 [Eumeta japonica]|uniref:Uncharacterized protein n=1 Tax=Eumeta variegata TaxID=151549 RepID=A0A4C1UW59_EUMVA|nr:hypothetical protein EVAR_94699_1 [Eumeta japonica]
MNIGGLAVETPTSGTRGYELNFRKLIYPVASAVSFSLAIFQLQQKSRKFCVGSRPPAISYLKSRDMVLKSPRCSNASRGLLMFGVTNAVRMFAPDGLKYSLSHEESGLNLSMFDLT